MKNQDKKVLNTVLVGALAAMVYVVTLFRFPLLGSKVHFANAVCLLAGLLLGPNLGGVAAGLGSALYDLTMYACVCGALTYVALYMLKTGVYGAIAGNIWAPMVSKFPASIINAGAAIVAAPVFYQAVRPALRAAGILRAEG